MEVTSHTSYIIYGRSAATW